MSGIDVFKGVPHECKDELFRLTNARRETAGLTPSVAARGKTPRRRRSRLRPRRRRVPPRASVPVRELFVFLEVDGVLVDADGGREPEDGHVRHAHELLGHHRPEVLEQLSEVREALGPDVQVLPISAVTGFGLDALRKALADALIDAGRWGKISDT